jgi:EAL domain-containing protein (putative c-di-GMP-specific phosphodiesterase class I)
MAAKAVDLIVGRKRTPRSVRDELPIDNILTFSRDQLLRAAPNAEPVAKGCIRLERHLGDALRRNALDVHYQPQFELKSGRGCGVEALARWLRPRGAIVAPSVFIPLAEQTGMIHELGRWILNCACKSMVDWGNHSTPAPILSVNVSVLQINAEFVRVIERALFESGLPAHQLELEITESAFIADTERMIEYLREWKSLGVSISMDDFGTGYSSLSCLARLPVDRLKLDLSLVHRMTLDSKGAAIVRALVSLGSDLGLDVCAEGIETERQLEMLMEFDCPRGQGYLFGRPMPARHAEIVLGKAWGDRRTLPTRQLSVATGVSNAY